MKLLTARRLKGVNVRAYVFVGNAGQCSESAAMDPASFDLVKDPGAWFLVPASRAVEIYALRSQGAPGRVIAFTFAFGLVGAAAAAASQTECKTAVSFVPEAGASYELVFHDDETDCRAMVQEVYRDDDGEMVAEPIPTKDPRTCPRPLANPQKSTRPRRGG